MTLALTSSNYADVDTLRQGDLDKLRTVLESQRARSIDVVVPARQIDIQGTDIRLTGIEPAMDLDTGVTVVDGLYTPTNVAERGISSKLGIPLEYLRRTRTQAADVPGLYRDNVKGWLDCDERNFLLRLFRSDNENGGILRAFVSDEFGLGLDNFDGLLAVLAGMQKAGLNPENMIIDADLTPTRMIVRVVVPEVAVYAEHFLQDYRNPFTGEKALRGWTPQRLREVAKSEGHDVQDKVIFAGFVFTNSEVGEGAFRLTPRLVIGPCTNGLQLTAESFARNHIGAKLEAGMVVWSPETYKANLDLITSQASDTVKSFLDVDFVTKQVEKLERRAAEPLDSPQQVIHAVSKRLGFTETQANDIFGYFIKGGQMTVGGVAQAITATAQVISDGDTALEMERAAVTAMTYAHEANKQLVEV